MTVNEQDKPNETFMSLYLAYTSETECPTFFHRWCGLTCLAAWLGRDVYFPFGHNKIHANMYVMLVGLAGTKKSTSIKIGAKILREAGFTKFAAKKTRQEKFLIDLAESAGLMGDSPDGVNADNILEMNLFGDEDVRSMPPAEVFVAADEANNFIGVGNLDFMSILGELWDIDEPYDYKLKNSKSVLIPNPTVSILSGNTFVGFNKLFPPEATEQGFFSRMLFIYAEPKGREYTIPPEPDSSLLTRLVQELHKIKEAVKGKMVIEPDAYELLDRIYMQWEGMGDIRFDAYENRRIVHLLKIAMLSAAMRYSISISKRDIMEASTILTYTEHLMPKALGEFGRAHNSSEVHKIMTTLDAAIKPMSFLDLWKVTYQDFSRREQLMEVLGNLNFAGKIQAVEGGYLPSKKVRTDGVEGAINWDILTPEERDLI